MKLMQSYLVKFKKVKSYLNIYYNPYKCDRGLVDRYIIVFPDNTQKSFGSFLHAENFIYDNYWILNANETRI